MAGIELSPQGEEALISMVNKSQRVAEMTNKELAQVLVDVTGDMPVDTWFWAVLMEAAERLSKELFDEAEQETLHAPQSE